ncbi:hypothetical protein JT359_08765 [Candidatus Poribacteria bacterium]|nr:hypothetical protein [Candidatus Poribacteria bacterium]
MEISTSLRLFILTLLFSLLFTYTSTAQDYYPPDIGNEWVMESPDGKEKRTYTLETPEDPADQDYILLKIETEDLEKNEIDIDRYFITTDEEGIKLHKTAFTIAQFAVLGDIIATLSPPVIFFRKVLSVGDKWKIVADATISTLELESITNLEVVGYEDVVTPAGTFHFCAKVKLEVSTTGLIELQPTTSYQWLAPDVGPIKYENSNGVVYELVSYNLHTPTQEPDNTEETPIVEVEPDATQEEENQDTEAVFDDMTYEQTPMTPQDPEEGDPQEEMDQTDENTTQEESEVGTPEEDDTQEEIQDDTESTTPETEVEETKNPYDVTGDGIVNILDLVRVASYFGEENTEVDVTGDGIINILDLVAIAQNFSP